MDAGNPNNVRNTGSAVGTGSGGGGDKSMKSLLAINNLAGYSLPPSLSVVVSRSHKLFYPSADVYSTNGNPTVSFTFTSGSDYIYGPDSFLEFDVTCTYVDDPVTTNGVFQLGKYGSILNIFKKIRIVHASGTEVENIDGLNLLNTVKLNYHRTKKYRESVGSAFGHCGAEDHGASLARNTAVRFAVPLSMLSDFFNKEELIPSYVAAGLRLQLDLEQIQLAFKSTSSNAGAIVSQSYSVSNAKLHLDCTTLSDAVQKQLAKQSQSEGLDIAFKSYWRDQIGNFNSAHQTVSISKALSRVEDIVVIPRQSSTLVTTGNGAESARQNHTLIPEPTFPFSSWQVNIGSMYIPSHPVTSNVGSYMISTQGLDSDNGISFTEYKDSLGIIRSQLERSNILMGSGLAISANRGATVDVHVPSAEATPRELTTFVQHTRLVTVFLDHAVVRT